MKTHFALLLWVTSGLLSSGLSAAHVLILPQELHSSDGCGPNPLSIVFSAANDLGHMAASEVMSVLESDSESWGEFLSLIHTYDDCIRAGQLRYKRQAASYPRIAELSQVQEVFRRSSRSPLTLATVTPMIYKYGHHRPKVPGVSGLVTRQLLSQKLLRQGEPYLKRETSNY